MIITNAVHSILLVAALQQGAPSPPPGGDLTQVVQRIATTVQLAAQEYRVGVSAGRVIAPAEVAEARLFLAEAVRTAGRLPPESSAATVSALNLLLAAIGRTADPDSVALGARTLTAGLADRYRVDVDQVPSAAPSLARGAQVYQKNCAGCHGLAGRGDGPDGLGLTPPPATLNDGAGLADLSPLDYYRRITIGVAGTAMPAFETRLSSSDRWAAAAYATLLRYPAPAGEVPAGLRAFGTTARMSDRQIAEAIGGIPDQSAAAIAAVRSFHGQDSGAESAAVFAQVGTQLDSALALAALGESDAAGGEAFEAYLTFEQVESGVRAVDPALAGRLEASFATLRGRVSGGATAGELRTLRAGLGVDLARAERLVAEPMTGADLFVQSFVILLREGLEAILLIGALIAFLVKTGNRRRRRDIHVGVAAAVVVSLLTAVAFETIFRFSPASQEVLEGVTMLVATAALFYVSYWLLSKMEVAKWNRFVKGKVQDALVSGSAFALPSVAFLAVYREGVETVLFYKALLLAGPAGGAVMPVLLGIAAASVVLGVVYVLINRFGVKLPLKPFFGVTSAFLYYMAFVFAGKGVAELQGGGVVPITVVEWAPQIERLGIYRTVESLAVQGVLLLLFVIALVWTFYLEPRRLRVTQELVPDPLPPAADAGAVVESKAPSGGVHFEVDLLRSLDRMDADLAELRAEVARLKARLHARQY
ncbi:MAG TPA: FTR1 family protein [Gemmatimonadales bacterium]|nr:FTR1 family protein [Gemmatimonadales bacterium]